MNTKDKAKKAEYNKRYREKHKEELKIKSAEYSKKYRETHKEELLKKQREYHKAHPEKCAANQAKWEKENPEKKDAIVKRYIQKKTNKDIEDILNDPRFLEC